MKKLITLLLIFILCFSLCACGEKNDTVKILKSKTTTLYPENSFEVFKVKREYNTRGNLISEKSYSKFGDAEFVEKGADYYTYDDEGRISLIECSDGSIFNFEQKFEDGYYICSAVLNGVKYEYTYQNSILIKREEQDINIGHLSRIFYNDKGCIIKQETSTSSFVVESICNDNGDIVETISYDLKGNLTEKVSFTYEANFPVSKIQESKDNTIEIYYSTERIDDSVYKSTQLGEEGNYILYEFDEKDNLISTASYLHNKISEKTEYEWVNK